MAQSLTAKRIRIAGNAVGSCTALYDAAAGLAAEKIERDQAGAFTDAELQADPTLAHTTAFMVGLVLDTLAADITTFLAGNVGNNVSNPTRRDLLQQMRK